MRQLTWFVTAVGLLPPLSGVTYAQDAAFQAPGLRSFVLEVLEKNAGYRGAGIRVAAAGERVAPAGALPDPTIMFGMMSVPAPSFDFAAEAMTQLPVMVQQRFPFPGKQSAATAVARADSMVAGEVLDALEANLVLAATRAYYELAYARTALGIWRGRVVLADQAVQVAQVRYETGAAPQTDLLRARLRRAELEEQRHQLEAARIGAVAHVDALRGGPGDSIPVSPLIGRDGQRTPDVLRDSLPSDTMLAEQLADGSPALRITAAEVQRAERTARVFGIAGRPDFTVSLQNSVRLGGREPFVTVLVGVSVPLWSRRKQAPAARAARLDVDATRQRYDDLFARLTGELQSALADLRALQLRIAQMSDEILPLAAAASTSALQRYQVGAVGFTTVLDTQDDLFRAQLRLAQLISDYGADRAQLAALVGEEWYK